MDETNSRGVTRRRILMYELSQRDTWKNCLLLRGYIAERSHRFVAWDVPMSATLGGR